MKTAYKHLTIERFEHDTVYVTSSLSGIEVLFDPFQSIGSLKAGKNVDLVLISHDHFDHFSPKDITSAGGRITKYAFPASILDKIQTFLSVSESQLLPVVPLEEYTVETTKGSIKCMAVPAYNIDKKSPQGNLYHPKERAYVGFVLEIDGVSLYFCGDTDNIPEMKVLNGMIEVMFVPISGVYVMTVTEAVDAVSAVNPALVIPMHYGSIVGDQVLGTEFQEKMKTQLPHITVEI